jgi:hypothetical protein
MLEWILVIITLANFFIGNYNGSQTQVRNYQTQTSQAMGSAYWSPGGPQGYYYGSPPQAYAYPPGY